MQMRNRYESDKSAGRAKLLTVDEGCARYSFGRATMRKVAEDAGAVVRIGRVYRINTDKVDRYIDAVSQ